MLDVELTVREALSEVTGRAPDKIKPDASLKDLMRDSLDMLELKMRLEERFDVELKNEMFENAATLREITHRITAALQHL